MPKKAWEELQKREQSYHSNTEREILEEIEKGKESKNERKLQ